MSKELQPDRRQPGSVNLTELEDIADVERAIRERHERLLELVAVVGAVGKPSKFMRWKTGELDRDAISGDDMRELRRVCLLRNGRARAHNKKNKDDQMPILECPTDVDVFLAHHPWLCCTTGRNPEYFECAGREGIYEPVEDIEARVSRFISRLDDQWERASRRKSAFMADLYGRCALRGLRPGAGGLVDWRNMEVEPFDRLEEPAIYLATHCVRLDRDGRVAERIPYGCGVFALNMLGADPDPAASAARTLAWLRERCGGDEELVQAALEMAAYCLAPCHWSNNKRGILFLKGGKDTGKSMYLRWLGVVLGEENVASGDADLFTPERVSQNRGKLVVVLDESFGSGPRWERDLKRLTGRGEFTARSLYRSSHQDRPSWKVVIAANETPRFLDSSSACSSRFIMLPWTRRIDAADQRSEREMVEMFRADLPGVLHLCLQTIPDLVARGGVSEPAASAEILLRIQQETNALDAWLRTCTKVHPEHVEAKAALFDSFKEFCRVENRQPLSFGEFCSRLRDHPRYEADFTDQTESGGRLRRQVNGRKQDVMMGLRITEPSSAQRFHERMASARGGFGGLFSSREEAEEARRLLDEARAAAGREAG